MPHLLGSLQTVYLCSREEGELAAAEKFLGKKKASENIKTKTETRSQKELFLHFTLILQKQKTTPSTRNGKRILLFFIVKCFTAS